MSIRFNPADIFHTTGGPPAGQTAAAFAPGGYYNPLPAPQAQPVGIPYAPQPDNAGVNSGGTNPGAYTQPVNYNLPPQAGSFIKALLGQGGMTNPDPGIVGGIEPPWLGHTQPAMPTPEQWAAIAAKIGNQFPFQKAFQNPQNGLVGGGGGGPFTRNAMTRTGMTGPSPFQAQPQQPVAAVDPRRIFQALAMNKAMGGFNGNTQGYSPQQLMALRQQHQAQAPAGSARGGYQPTY